MNTTLSPTGLQTDDFIQEYLSHLQENSFQENRREECLMVSSENTKTWKTPVPHIEDRIEEMFNERVTKIERDLIMQDQYTQHNRVYEGKMLFGAQ